MARLTVASSGGPYEVVVERGWRGLREALADRPRPILVTDANVAPLWADAVAAELGAEVPRIVLPAGEGTKDLDTWRACVERLLDLGVDRRTPVLALGGGVIGDLAGFAAATTLRGLPLVQLPTTLLAMVDSSVGGKVGIDLRGKNLVGAFHPPILVWAALDALATLPPREVRAGLAEVVKMGVACDEALLGLVEERAEALAAGRDLEDVVVRSVAVKAEVVGADEREEGRRIVLNAGHTAGHALETAAGGALLHGEAVAIGLVAELRYAARAGICRDPELPDRVERLLARLGLPTRSAAHDRVAARAALRLDKKGHGDKIRIALPVRAGASAVLDLPRAEADVLLQLTEEPPG